MSNQQTARPTPAPTTEPAGLVLLGATGSIGDSTLEVIRQNPDALRLAGIACRSRWDKLAAIAREFSVPWVAIYDETAAREARDANAFPPGTQILDGAGGLRELASLPEAGTVLPAIVGTLGLEPTLAAVEAGKKIALASKEILVLAGSHFMEAVRRRGVEVLPVDSEHNAIFQCLQGHRPEDVYRLLLTASGGAFLDWPLADLAKVGPEQALKHPNWSMGPKVTVDSASMANKGLELMEARWLFDIEPSRIDVIIHRQSIVHSMVEFLDGSMLAQLSPPSMTFAIQHALLHPARAAGARPGLDFSQALRFDFEPPEKKRFPCLGLAREALEAGGNAPAVFNAANEVAVEAFLAKRIGFLDIPAVIKHTLDSATNAGTSCLEEILGADREARHRASSFLNKP